MDHSVLSKQNVICHFGPGGGEHFTYMMGVFHASTETVFLEAISAAIF